MLQSTTSARAHAIFEATALSRDDVEPSLITELVAHELEQASGFFRTCLADNKWWPEEFVPHIEHLVEVSAYYADVVVHHPYAALSFEGKDVPVHAITAELCRDICAVLADMHMNPEWRSLYDHIGKRLEYYAGILEASPDHKVRHI